MVIFYNQSLSNLLIMLNNNNKLNLPKQKREFKSYQNNKYGIVQIP